ncbi:MAG: carboxypeptidase regulatory-like domain-containing protein [Acidobacteriota bacterium]|nr:carboxypeptidase regulatory-like domain-containing protein [Acidobacteriota bacterium]
MKTNKFYRWLLTIRAIVLSLSISLFGAAFLTATAGAAQPQTIFSNTVPITIPSSGASLGSPNPATVTIPASSLPPITFVVNADDDMNDGACNTTHCSLREAIIAANANTGTSQPDRIEFNIPGNGVHIILLTSQTPQITDPVVIDGTTQPGFDTSTHLPRIELKTATSGPITDGLVITGGNSTVRALAISNLARGSGIVITTNGGNVIQGCFIGTDATGTVQGFIRNSPIIITAPNNLIGGTSPGARNIFSGGRNGGLGISGSSASGNIVQGNYIGTDITGTNDFGNNFGGIKITAPNNIIGGTENGAGNLISGNRDGELLIVGIGASGNVVQGNFIGTNGTGTAALDSNSFYGGVTIDNALNNLIGGTAPGARNVISGNRSGVSIGGSSASGNKVQGNFIGTGINGAALPNLSSGVFVGAPDNLIGGSAVGAGNIIAHNATKGILISSDATGNQILTNSIFNNGTLGIDLLGGTPDANGVNLNDAGDPDTGGNKLQNYPVVTSAFNNGGTTNISGTLNSTPNRQFRIEFFSNSGCSPTGFGEGETFIGSQSVTTDSNGNVTVNFTPSGTVPMGQFITSTATDPEGNTSEFSACRQVALPTAASVSIGGRIMTAKGRGTSNVLLILTDSTGETRTVMSNAFGYYRFTDVSAGATYTLTASAKRFVFDNPTQTLFVSGEMTEINFLVSP